MRCTVLAVAVSLAAPPAGAQVDEIVTAKLDGHSIAALVTRQESAKVFKHGIAILPGWPGKIAMPCLKTLALSWRVTSAAMLWPSSFAVTISSTCAPAGGAASETATAKTVQRMV